MASLKKVFLDCMQVRHFSAQTQTAYLRWVMPGKFKRGNLAIFYILETFAETIYSN
jgi:hypothetical protein